MTFFFASGRKKNWKVKATEVSVGWIIERWGNLSGPEGEKAENYESAGTGESAGKWNCTKFSDYYRGGSGAGLLLQPFTPTRDRLVSAETRIVFLLQFSTEQHSCLLIVVLLDEIRWEKREVILAFL